MYQIQFWLRLRPRPSSWIKGPTSKGREGKGDREGKEGIRKKERGGREKAEGRRRGTRMGGKFRGQGDGREKGREKGREEI